MSASKSRPRWEELPPAVRTAIEELVGGAVRQARSCPGGFSPGFASRLVLADGRRCFVKAIDAVTWPWEAELYRAEAQVNAVLPAGVPAPRLLGHDDGDWTILAFADVDGAEPSQPWHPDELDRVVAADGVDPGPLLRRHVPHREAPPPTVDAILAAHAGFLLHGGLTVPAAGLAPIAEAKLRLGLGALRWLRHRLTGVSWAPADGPPPVAG